MIDTMPSASADDRGSATALTSQDKSYSQATPLDGAVTVTDRHADGITATYTVRVDESVLIGHFPGFPIFPGVCLIECAHQASSLALSGNVTLVAVERVRFLAPVYPDDEITVRVRVSGFTCRTDVTVRRGLDGVVEDAATIRLRYRNGAPC